ncbi:MAG: hypothetical protein ACLPTF_01490 [Steroidobacteraceae bacterium]
MSAASYPLFGRRSVFVTAAVIAVVLGCQFGCVATLISYGGPGSWKREALWDEYVVTLVNHGERPFTIDSATLADSAGTPYAPGSDPWALEKQSKKLEKQYRDHGEAFLRAAGPGVLIVGVGAATASAAAGSTVFISAGVAGAAMATVVVLPVYYLSVLGINHHNKKAVMTEFKRRRLPLPLTLAPGETRTGSLFYPMVRSPGSLALYWSNETGSATAVLPLEFLQALHVPAKKEAAR